MAAKRRDGCATNEENYLQRSFPRAATLAAEKMEQRQPKLQRKQPVWQKGVFQNEGLYPWGFLIYKVQSRTSLS